MTSAERVAVLNRARDGLGNRDRGIFTYVMLSALADHVDEDAWSRALELATAVLKDPVR